MGFWTAIVLIVAMCGGAAAYRSYLAHRRDHTRESEAWADLARRVESLERRAANLETLLLEKDVDRRFEALERDA